MTRDQAEIKRVKGGITKFRSSGGEVELGAEFSSLFFRT